MSFKATALYDPANESSHQDESNGMRRFAPRGVFKKLESARGGAEAPPLALNKFIFKIR